MSNCEYFSAVFYNCTSLTTAHLPEIVSGKLSDVSSMFYNCTKLTNIDVSTWNTANVTNISYAFYNCDALTTLDLSGWNMKSLTNSTYMFGDCGKLTTIYAHDWAKVVTPTTIGYEFYQSTKLVGKVAYNSSYYGWSRASNSYYFTHPDDWDSEETVAPTCADVGSHSTICDDCGYVKTELLYATVHRADENNICTVCGESALYLFDTYNETYFMTNTGAWSSNTETGYYYAIIPVEVGKTYKATLTDVTTLIRWRCAQATSDVINGATLTYIWGTETPANGNTFTFTATQPYLICYGGKADGGAVIMDIVE